MKITKKRRLFRILAVVLSTAMLLSFTTISWAADTENLDNENDISAAGDVNPTDMNDDQAEEEILTLSENAIMPLSASESIEDEVTIEGITYSFTMDPATHTATLTDIANPDVAAAVTVPDTFIYGDEGETYTVTDLKWSDPTFTTSRRRENITGLALPATLERTNKVKFYKFPNLTEITIPGSVDTFDGNFQNMKLLKSITFENGVKTIDSNSMASSCPLLTEINLPDTLTTIGDSTFSGITALESFTIPAGVTEIPYCAFERCTSLVSVEAEGVTSLGRGAFQNCTALESFTTSGTLTSVEGYAFNGCIDLTEIPDLGQVTEMGENAFYYCESLEIAVDLSSLDAIPDKAFSYAAINGVKFSDNLKSIGIWAFLYTHITSIEFPDSLESIGDYGFWYAWIGYPNGTLKIPDSVTSVGDHAFQHIYAESIWVGSGLTEIGESVFSDIKNLKEITFNNSRDDILGDLGLSEDVTIHYLVESIGDVRDTISDSEDALTLQKAVNAAANGDVITIYKDVKLSRALNIPADKNITITAEDEGGFTIIGDKDANLGELIKVEAGASVTFGGNLIISGRYNNGSTIDNEGTVTLTENASVQAGRVAAGSNGVINTHGTDAKFIMTGGSVSNNTISGSNSGTIRVSDGASVSIQGGTIQGNKSTNLNSSAGILLYQDASGEMTGGTISGNTAVRGSAIMLYHHDNSNKETRTQFTLSGEGIISDNICRTDGEHDAAGTVYVYGYADFTMTGGTITDNRATIGAGVCVYDPGLASTPATTEFKTGFIMEGGTISNNVASGKPVGTGAYMASGGGIYSFSNGVQLKAGTISGNQASMGGGIYSEGNKNNYSTLHMENVVITDNHSDDQGGGMWYCATGDAKVYILSGGAIYGNTADGAGDDVVSGSKTVAAGKTDSSVTLADRVLGGGRVLWYQDGGVHFGGISLDGAYPSTRSDKVRFGMDGADTTPVTVQESQSDLALKAVIDSSAADYASSQAKLFITGNTATCYGGGVGANGGVVIGEAPDPGELKDITVKKEWNDENDKNGARPDSITVKLILETEKGKVILERLTLTGDSWQGTFKDLPSTGTYTVAEEPVNNYKVSAITGDAENGFIIQNMYFPSGSLTVSKNVVGGSTTQEFPFTVTLDDKSATGQYGSMYFENGIATFTLKHNESITATSLPAGTRYTVTETVPGGYSASNNNATGTIIAGQTAQVTVTNTKSSDPGPGPGGDTTSITVKKVWKLDDGGMPTDSVKVQLIRNGIVYGTVDLSASNNWGYTWTNLSTGFIWTVQEVNVPDGFTSEVLKNGTTFTITNDDIGDIQDNPNDPDNPNKPAEPNKPDNPNKPDKPDKPGSGSETDTEGGTTTVPKTGDEQHLTFWLLLMLATLAAFGVTLEAAKRKRQ